MSRSSDLGNWLAADLSEDTPDLQETGILLPIGMFLMGLYIAVTGIPNLGYYIIFLVDAILPLEDISFGDLTPSISGLVFAIIQIAVGIFLMVYTRHSITRQPL
ncbi:MAG: hypothetical protein AAF996_17300 [Pseudomonadota bacterium]